MGIKENFSQAMRELTGGGKDDRKGDRSIDGMKNAVAAEDTGEFDPVKEDNTDFDEIEKRAAAAADEYSRRQSAFEAENFINPDEIYNSEAAPVDPEETVTGQSFRQPEQSFTQPSQDYSQPQQSFTQPQQGGFNQQQNFSQQSGFGQQNNQQSFRPQQPAYNPQPSFGRDFRQPTDDNETTVISRNTVIDGNIHSFANMTVDGNIKGNVETTKDIDLNGKIVGDISCNNAKLRTSQVQGNIRLKGNVYMERETLLLGDLTSTYANINGKIKGNVSTGGKTELKSDAVVFGDISASSITVDDGAIIQGYVSTTFLNKEDSKGIFPDTITIGE
ncbi:MAG: polymer-forming cytoskeletal protein [Ruminiclostridium sp.]